MPSKATRKTTDHGSKPREDATALFKEESKPAWKPDSIESHRARMDRINLEILKLISERASHANEIGRIKHSSGAPVYQPAREREVIEAMVAANPGPLSAEQKPMLVFEPLKAARRDVVLDRCGLRPSGLVVRVPVLWFSERPGHRFIFYLPSIEKARSTLPGMPFAA